MEQAEFDKFADEYRAMLADTIRASGESPEYFSRYKIRHTADWCARHAHPVATILDFGAGTGNSIPYFREFFPRSMLTATDVSAKSLEIAGQRFPGQALLVPFDGARLPFPDASFDLAFTACVLHHIPHAEHPRWFAELRRVVRPRGVLAIFEHNPLNPLTVRAVNDCPFDENACLIRATALKRALRDAGWRDVSVDYTVFFPAALARLRGLEAWLRWLPLGAQYAVFARPDA